MLLEDIAVGWVLSKLFGSKGEQQTQSPGVFFPPAGTPAATTPAATPAAPAPDFPAQVPVPATAPATPTPGAPAAGNQAPAGFKRAVEMWIVSPQIAQQGSSLISGMGPQVGAMAFAALQAQFPKGWQRAKSATQQEQAFAKSLLPKWQDGKVTFTGNSLATGRAWQYTKHPGVPATVPAAPPAAPAPAFPAQVPVPATAPAAPTTAPSGPVVTRTPEGGTVTTLPEVLITADAPPSAVKQITLVRRGEGLANVAKRLGQPATGTSATVLQRENVPGPDGLYTAQSLDKGGLKKKNRAGGLQPGDRLFVPPQWGPVAADRL